MTKGVGAALAAAAAGLMAGSGASAHHSGAMFDRTKEVTLVGTLKEIHWTNPHGWLDMVVDGPNGTTPWSVEIPPPGALVKLGLKRTPPYPAPGDKISVIIHPLRDGRNAGSYITMTLADGKTLGGTTR